MEWETARTSVDFLFEKAGGNREVNLIFFGGEALLNIKLMQTDRRPTPRRKGKLPGRRSIFSLTTNGTLLTDEIIDFFQAIVLASLSVSTDLRTSTINAESF